MSLETQLDLIVNGDKYNKRISELKEIEARIDAKLAKYDKAVDLETALEEAKADREKARQTLQDAERRLTEAKAEVRELYDRVLQITSED